MSEWQETNRKHYREYQRKYHQTYRKGTKNMEWRKEYFNEEYYPKNREQIIKRTKKSNNKNPIKTMIRAAKFRAKRNNIPFNITEQDVEKVTHCPIFGMELIYGAEGGQKENSASLDKVIPSLGYVKGNVRIISWRANRLKGHWNLEDLEAIREYITHHIGQMLQEKIDPDK